MFLLLGREYFSSGVDMLTNTFKISDVTERDKFRLNLSQSDESEIRKKSEKSVVVMISEGLEPLDMLTVEGGS